MNTFLITVVIGIGATALMDVWGFARKPLFGIRAPNYGVVGRWIGHMYRGKFRHQAIEESPAVRGEHLIGWATHYLTGCVFAAFLVGIWGTDWVQNPSPGPAMVVGLSTITIPFFIVQPSIGAGFASSRTRNPSSARLQSLITHAVFGAGLYIAACVLQLLH